MRDAPDLAQVRSNIEYKVNDPTWPGGKRDVERDELSRGYLYGSTAVPISTEDENVTKLETVQSFEIIGFIPSDKVSPLRVVEEALLMFPSTSDISIWESATLL
jgi:ATP-dependent DNA helicase 2 subunit 2